MNLDNILNKSMRKTLHREIKPRKRQPYNKEKKDLANIRYIIKRIKTGDYDSTKRSHQIKLGMAIKQGYVEKGTLVILKEE